MEVITFSSNYIPDAIGRLVPAAVPMVLISMGYLDPGKWATVFDGGARFGFELVMPMLFFSLAAIFCQYLSARVGVVTGKDLSQVCRVEYDKRICIILQAQAEFSVFALNLTNIVGIAYGVSNMFGIDLFISVLLTAIAAVLCPHLCTQQGEQKGTPLCICMAVFIFLFYVLGVVFNQPKVSLPMNWMHTRSDKMTAFVLTSLLGATVMPHNFYLHSPIVQQQRPGQYEVTKSALCHRHLFVILTIFGAIFFMNYIIMHSAENMFYSTDILFNAQDMMSLINQARRIPLGPSALAVLFFSNQITVSIWDSRKQVFSYDFHMDIPAWLHRRTIRNSVLLLLINFLWSLEPEELYHLLIFMQVMVALVLPSSLIPLVHVASSSHIMGSYRVPHLLALVPLIGIVGLNFIFLIELMFGSKDSISNLGFMGCSSSFSYVLLLIVSVMSLCLMLWLAVTPLKSANNRLKDQFPKRKEKFCEETGYDGRTKLDPGPEASSALRKPLGSQSEALHEELSHIFPDETHFDIKCPSFEISDVKLIDAGSSKSRSMSQIKKILEQEANSQFEDGETDARKAGESVKRVLESSPTAASESLLSLGSLRRKGDEGGKSSNGLTRSVGLSCAQRRQFSTIVEEFWGQLYDYHGQATNAAKEKKLIMLLQSDSRQTNSQLKVGSNKDLTGMFTSSGEGGAKPSINSSLRGSLKQNTEPISMALYHLFGKESSSFWFTSNNAKLLDRYVTNLNHNILDSCERCYSSSRLPPSFDSRVHQPATAHFSQIGESVRQIPKGNGLDHSYAHMEKRHPIFSSSDSIMYGDLIPHGLSQKPPNGLNSVQSCHLESLAGFSNASLQSEILFHRSSSGTSHAVRGPAREEKNLCLPTGFSAPHQDMCLPSCNSIKFGSSEGQSATLPFDMLSPSNIYRGACSINLGLLRDSGSLWSVQPSERFGVVDKFGSTGGKGSQNSRGSEETFYRDLESELLQSFRHCIMKLLNLDRSNWLFTQSGGAEEELIDYVAATEKVLHEAEIELMSKSASMDYAQNELDFSRFLNLPIPRCGESCVWKVDLIISFGVWCIHRILDLSLKENQPELWGKYTYALNCLQGIISLAFSEPRDLAPPCVCLLIPANHRQKAARGVSNGDRRKCTTASAIINTLKDIETSKAFRKSRNGTTGGGVAFRKGKENLASVLKRYRRHFSKFVNASSDDWAVPSKVHKL